MALLGIHSKEVVRSETRRARKDGALSDNIGLNLEVHYEGVCT